MCAYLCLVSCLVTTAFARLALPSGACAAGEKCDMPHADAAYVRCGGKPEDRAEAGSCVPFVRQNNRSQPITRREVGENYSSASLRSRPKISLS